MELAALNSEEFEQAARHEPLELLGALDQLQHLMNLPSYDHAPPWQLERHFDHGHLIRCRAEHPGRELLSLEKDM